VGRKSILENRKRRRRTEWQIFVTIAFGEKAEVIDHILATD